MKPYLKTLKEIADKLPVGAVEVKTKRPVEVDKDYQPMLHTLPSAAKDLTSEFKLTKLEWRPSDKFLKQVGKDFPIDQVPDKHKEYFAYYTAMTPINHFLRLKKQYALNGWQAVITYVRKNSDPNIVDQLIKIIIQANNKYT